MILTLGSLIRHRRSLYHEGRRYAVRGPTYATVHAFLALYGDEVVAMARAQIAQPGVVDVDAALRICASGPRAVEVLATCVDTDADPQDWPVDRLARTVLGLCDLDQILEAIDVDGIAKAGEDRVQPAGEVTDVPDEVAWVLRVAREYRVAPSDVMDWPYGALLTASACLVRGDGATGRLSGEDGFMGLVRDAAMARA